MYIYTYIIIDDHSISRPLLLHHVSDPQLILVDEPLTQSRGVLPTLTGHHGN